MCRYEMRKTFSFHNYCEPIISFFPSPHLLSFGAHSFPPLSDPTLHPHSSPYRYPLGDSTSRFNLPAPPTKSPPSTTAPSPLYHLFNPLSTFPLSCSSPSPLLHPPPSTSSTLFTLWPPPIFTHPLLLKPEAGERSGGEVPMPIGG